MSNCEGAIEKFANPDSFFGVKTYQIKTPVQAS
jgi:hypothetical protein